MRSTRLDVHIVIKGAHSGHALDMSEQGCWQPAHTHVAERHCPAGTYTFHSLSRYRDLGASAGPLTAHAFSQRPSGHSAVAHVLPTQDRSHQPGATMAQHRNRSCATVAEAETERLLGPPVALLSVSYCEMGYSCTFHLIDEFCAHIQVGLRVGFLFGV